MDYLCIYLANDITLKAVILNLRTKPFDVFEERMYGSLQRQQDAIRRRLQWQAFGPTFERVQSKQVQTLLTPLGVPFKHYEPCIMDMSEVTYKG